MLLRLLIIEDNREFADYLHRGLTYEGYRVEVMGSAEQGLEELHRQHPDLIILDIMLPGIDGMVACRNFRSMGYTGPILMLTARNSVNDRVTGLDSGADQYMVKPFDFEELLARLRALFRRVGIDSQILSYGDLDLDVNLRAAYRGEKEILLTPTEYDLLVYFLKNPTRILSREELITNVWKQSTDSDYSVLDVYISRIRHKLGSPTLIRTVYATGYILKV